MSSRPPSECFYWHLCKVWVWCGLVPTSRTLPPPESKTIPGWINPGFCALQSDKKPGAIHLRNVADSIGGERKRCIRRANTCTREETLQKLAAIRIH